MTNRDVRTNRAVYVYFRWAIMLPKVLSTKSVFAEIHNVLTSMFFIGKN